MPDLPAPSQTTKHTRYETLDGLRGVAAICVMVYHYVKGERYPILLSSPLAVDLFFMLSGFVIAHSYGRRLQSGMSATAYLVKRFIRLYPMFLLGLLLGLPSLYCLQRAGLVDNSAPGFILQSAAYNLFYLPCINGVTIHDFGASAGSSGNIFPSNSPSWSLFFEVVASVAFLGLFRLQRKGLVVTVVSSFLVFAACGFVPNLLFRHHIALDFQLGFRLDNILGGFPRVLYGFTVGLLLYSLVTDTRYDGLRASLARTIKHPFVLYLVLVLVLLFPSPLHGAYEAFVLVIIAPALVVAGSVLHSAYPASLAATRFLGWISYPVYCLHFPIGNLMFLLVINDAHLSSGIAIAASILASLAVSIVLTKAIEEPVRAWLSKLTTGPTRQG